MYCTNCGGKIEEGSRFCTNCGNSCFSGNNNGGTNNTKESISLVFGVLSFIFFWFPILSLVFAVIGIVFGIKFKNESGKFAKGIIFSGIGILLSILMIVCSIFVTSYFISSEKGLDYIIEEYGEYFDDNNSFDISGNDWIGDDGSLLQLDKSSNYSWYQDSDGTGNSYFLGDYVYYNGYDAMNYIADKLGEYGITREEQRNLFRLGDYDIEDYYLIILNCEKMVMEGIEQQPSVSEMYYYGFLDDDNNRLELVNMRTGNEAGFKLKSVSNFGGVDL